MPLLEVCAGNLLVDHYSNTIRRDCLTDDVFNLYVLNPRVYNEMVEPSIIFSIVLVMT